MKSILIVCVVYAIAFAAEWGVTVGLIKLVTLCFGWDFSLAVATGIWIVFLLLRSIFGSSKKKED